MNRQVPEGMTVKYTHYRNIQWPDWPTPSLSRVDKYIKPNQILAKGGVTECYLFDPDGNKIGEAAAVCGPKDNFDKKIGRAIALGRALHALDKLS